MSDPHRAEPRRRAPLRPPTSRGRRTAALSATLAACLVLAGCTQIPQSSPVRTGEPLADNRASADTPQFRPPGPADGADAEARHVDFDVERAYARALLSVLSSA